MSYERAALWTFRDEATYAFLEQKYRDREKLGEEYAAARKLAEKSQTVDGKPNPMLPRLEMQADMAQMKLEMSYIIDRNSQLQQHIETIGYLHDRVGILEGAYGHTKMLAETCRIDYVLTKGLHEKLTKYLKEHEHVENSEHGKAASAKPKS